MNVASWAKKNQDTAEEQQLGGLLDIRTYEYTCDPRTT